LNKKPSKFFGYEFLNVFGVNHIHLIAMEEVICNFGLIARSGVPE
jgi:hypothetical protein